jgi:glutathione synthase
MRSKQNFSENSVVYAPFTLLPSPFPKLEFEKAVRIQSALNTLIHNVAHDHEFLKNTLKK